jgi:hypothetical protein
MNTAENAKNLNQNSNPESYCPKDKPAILSIAEKYISDKNRAVFPESFTIKPKMKIADYSGETWPHSNTMPAMLAALGLFYGRTGELNDKGELINSEKEYYIQNGLYGEAFSLFYPPVSQYTDLSNCFSVYGLSYELLSQSHYSDGDMTEIIKFQISNGNAMILRRGGAPSLWLVTGYSDNGKTLLGCEFIDGDDGKNCSYNFDKLAPLTDWTGNISYIIFIKDNGIESDRKVAYKKALENGYGLMTEKHKQMDYDNQRGAGELLYEKWIERLEKANAENSSVYYEADPVFPHFIALYENRLHLTRFLKLCADLFGSENLLKASELCGQLKDVAQDAAKETCVCQWADLKDATNNQRRDFLIDRLKKCSELEKKIAGLIKL